MGDLRAVGVDILTLGQYLRPTPNHLRIERYVTPEQFDHYRDFGLAHLLAIPARLLDHPQGLPP